MKIIYLKNGDKVLVDDEDFKWLNQWKWQSNQKGYIIRMKYVNKKNRKWEYIKMHRLIMNVSKNFQVDHINGNVRDNRKINLRIVTNAQNQRNKKICIKNKSGYKGVSWDKKNKKWLSKITFNYKQYNLGYYINKIDAVLAYDKASIKYFGVYGRRNIL